MKKSDHDDLSDLTIIIWGDGLNVNPPKDWVVGRSNKNDDPKSKGRYLRFKLLNKVEDDDNTDDVIRMSDCIEGIAAAECRLFEQKRPNGHI